MNDKPPVNREATPIATSDSAGSSDAQTGGDGHKAPAPAKPAPEIRAQKFRDKHGKVHEIKVKILRGGARRTAG